MKRRDSDLDHEAAMLRSSIARTTARVNALFGRLTKGDDDALKQRNADLQREVEELRSKVARTTAWLNALYTGFVSLLQWLFVGKDLTQACRRWGRALKETKTVPVDETADVVAAMFQRWVQVSTLALGITIVPTLLLGLQTFIMMIQSQTMYNQNTYLREQTTELRRQIDTDQFEARAARQAQLIGVLYDEQCSVLTEVGERQRLNAGRFGPKERLETRRPDGGGILEVHTPTWPDEIAECIPIASARARSEAFLGLTQLDPSHKFDFSYANLDDATLNRAILTEVGMAHAELNCASMIGANLTRANLSGAYLRVALMRDANLTGANLDHAQLWGADLTAADLSGASLVGADLREAILTSATLTGATLTGAKLDGASIDHATFIGASLHQASLVGAYGHLARLDNTMLDEANVTGAMLKGATFRTASMKMANLSGSVLVDSDFTGAIFDQTIMAGVECDGALWPSGVLAPPCPPRVSRTYVRSHVAVLACRSR